MSNDLIVSSVAAGPSNSSTAARRSTATTIEPPTQVAAELAAPLITNPTLRLDAALGLVVVEYLNDQGAITTSIPSQRELAAYRRWEATRIGPPPSSHDDITAAPAQQDNQRTSIEPSQHEA